MNPTQSADHKTLEAYDASRMCHTHTLYFDKRAKTRLTFDCSITIMFTYSTEWKDVHRSGQSIVFGIEEAELFVELLNGSVHMREANKLGTEIQLETEELLSRNSATEHNITAGIQVERRVGKDAGAKAGATVGTGRKISQGDSSEQKIRHVLVDSNLSLADKPVWTFKSAHGPLTGQLANRPIFTIKTRAKGDVDYRSWIEVKSENVVLHSLPSKWATRLRFGALREKSLKSKISELISHQASKIVDTNLETS